MTQKYEFARVRFECNNFMALMGSMDPSIASAAVAAHASIPLLVTDETDFLLHVIPYLSLNMGFCGEPINLYAQLQHNANDNFLTLKLLRVKSSSRNTNTGGFRKMDAIFQIKKADGTTLVSSRVLILDLNECSTFGCQCQGRALCFTTKIVCPVTGIKDAIVDMKTKALLAVTLNGVLISYGQDNMPAKLIELPMLDDTKMETSVLKPHDLVIKVDGQEFQTQKGILAEQSDIFSTMFSVQMKETKTGVLEIVDMTAKGVQALLAFFHNGQLNVFKDQDIFFELFHAAHKYNIRVLKETLVELSILMPLADCTLNHAIEFFCFAQHLESQVLETRALRIFDRLRSEFNESELMDSFIKKHPIAVKKLLILYANGRPQIYRD